MTDAAPNDKVSDILKKIPNDACHDKRDVYVTFEGRVLRRSGEVKASGISDGSTLQVASETRGGGHRKDKRTKADEKQVVGQESLRDMSPAIPRRTK